MNNENRPRRGLLDGLADIVGDLYGENAAANARLAEALKADEPVVVPAYPVENAVKPAAAPTYAAKPALPPFSALWKTADEPIDWTEALASATPTDGLTPPAKWALYHEHAAAVLRGNVAAYLDVLKAANPMADLMPYVATLDVSTANADELRAAFTVRPDLLESEPERYLSGMALRIARDLFAVLPVTCVNVSARQEDATLLNVRFERQELNRVRFAFIDPVEFVGQCGGCFTLPDA